MSVRSAKPNSTRRSRAVWCVLLAAAFLLLVLLTAGGCSDEIYNPETNELILVTSPSVPGQSGQIQWELPTEPSTGAVIGITPTDPYENAPHTLRVDYLSVGNADAILLRMDGKVILIDTGETDDYQKINTTLMGYGITTIDYLIISHYDNDHIGTAEQILRYYTVREVYMPDYIRDSRLYRRMTQMLDALVADGKTAVHRLKEDVNLSVGIGQVWINATKLYEPGVTLGSDDSHSLQENNYSLITAVTFGDLRLLFAGDAEGERMEEYAALCAAGAGMDFDVLKIPHHGGYDKGTGNFIREAGKNGLRYCMVMIADPSLAEASLITAIRSAGAGVYYTSGGDIRFATDGQTMTVTQ